MRRPLSVKSVFSFTIGVLILGVVLGFVLRYIMSIQDKDKAGAIALLLAQCLVNAVTGQVDSRPQWESIPGRTSSAE